MQDKAGEMPKGFGLRLVLPVASKQGERRWGAGAMESALCHGQEEQGRREMWHVLKARSDISQ